MRIIGCQSEGSEYEEYGNKKIVSYQSCVLLMWKIYEEIWKKILVIYSYFFMSIFGVWLVILLINL